MGAGAEGEAMRVGLLYVSSSRLKVLPGSCCNIKKETLKVDASNAKEIGRNVCLHAAEGSASGRYDSTPLRHDPIFDARSGVLAREIHTTAVQ